MFDTLLGHTVVHVYQTHSHRVCKWVHYWVKFHYFIWLVFCWTLWRRPKRKWSIINSRYMFLAFKAPTNISHQLLKVFTLTMNFSVQSRCSVFFFFRQQNRKLEIHWLSTRADFRPTDVQICLISLTALVGLKAQSVTGYCLKLRLWDTTVNHISFSGITQRKQLQ